MSNVISKGRRRFRKRTFKRGGNKPVRQYQFRKSIKRVIRRIPRPQRKYLDAYSAAVISPGTSYAYLLCLAQNNSVSGGDVSAITQGVTQNEFIGYKGVWKSYTHRMSLNRPAQITPTDTFLRVIVFIWKPSELTYAGNPNTPAIHQILDNGLSSTATSFTYLSPYSREWSKQYTILYDKTFTIAQYQTELVLDKAYKKLHKSFTAFAPIETGATLTSNVPYVYFISDNDVVNDQPIIKYWPRLSYTNQ